jgi:uncharacterized protein
LSSRRGAKRADWSEEAEGPLRLCALTRQERPVEDLIRFVAHPSGEIFPDLQRSLPGRGVWVSADKTSIEQAVRRNVFAKSLKRQVQVAPDLAEQIDTLLTRSAVQALALANKAGLVTMGFYQVDALIEKGKAALLLHGSDAADDGCGKLDRKFRAVARDLGIEAPIMSPFTIEQMSLAIGRSNVVHAALIHGGATEKVLCDAGRLERYRRQQAPIPHSDNSTNPEV